MAEVLGIVASTIAVMQLTGQVASLGYEYIGRVKRAPREVSDLVEELNSLKMVLNILVKYIEESQGLSGTQALDSLRAPILGCEQDLGVLQKRLSPRKGIKGVMDRLKWPIRDNEMAEIKSRIERYKSLFLLALSADQIVLAKDSEKHAKDTYFIVSDIQLKSDTFRKEEKRIKVLDWLTKENFNEKHIEISNRREEGTGEWVFRTPEFGRWVAREDSLLWGFGIPGAGKTFLSSAIIDRLQKKEAMIVVYVYFDYKEREQQKPINVLESLVKQLASQLPDLPKEIEALHDELEQKRRRPTADELHKALLATFGLFNNKVFLVIDALDECDRNRQRKGLLPLFHSIAEKCGVFVTSRQYPEDIQESFRRSAKIKLSANENDIRIYIERKISGNPRARRLVEQANCRERIVSELTDCASGMFLLVHFHIEHLCQQTTAKQILVALDKLKITPTDKGSLGPTYDRAIATLRSQPESCAKLGLMILSWLVKAKRVLKIEELRVAVSVEPNRLELDELDLPDKATIIDVCAGLVTIDEQSDSIRLVHYTVQEYLLNNPIVPGDAELKIAMACITFLSFDVFHQDSPTPYFSAKRWIISHPFLRYAAIYLSSHLHACDANLTTELVLRFIRRPNCIDNYLRFIMRHRRHHQDGYSYKRLLMWDCRQSSSQRLQDLHLASYLGHLPVVCSLLEQGANPSVHELGMWTPLHFAACGGWVGVVRLLIRSGADCSIRDRSGQTPLHTAASEGHIAVVEALLEKEADFSTKDLRGKTALDIALSGRSIEVAHVLLGKGAEFEITALFDAILDGQEEIVELLLDNGADFTAQDTKGDTALHLAAREGYSSLVRLLLGNGAKLSTLSKCGNTALHTAAFEGHKEVVELLLREDTGAEAAVLISNDAGETALHYAALRGDEESVRLLLDRGAKNSIPNTHGDTPLHNALSRGNDIVAKLLLGENTDSYDSQNSYGITPLQIAASKGNLALTKFFLEKGASLSRTDQRGDTALFFAAVMGHKAVVQLLLEEGADPSLQNKLGYTALHQAAFRGHKAVVQLLLKNGVDCSTQNSYRDTALHLAVSSGHSAVVKLLLDSMREVDLAVQNNYGDTALHQAASEGRHGVLKMLLQTKADFSAVNKFGSTPLHYAAWGGCYISAELLLKRFEPSVQDHWGNTALHTAARRGNTAIVKVLLGSGVDFSVKNVDGDTALHYAAWSGCEPIVELLLEKGANPSVPNKRQNTALHVAVSRGNSAVVRILFEELRARMREETMH